MELVVFQFWLLIFVLLIAYTFWKRDARLLLISGLMVIAFGWILAFEGLRVIDGINRTTGAYTYTTILPTNDFLFAFFAIGALPIGTALALYSLVVLYSETLAKMRF